MIRLLPGMSRILRRPYRIPLALVGVIALIALSGSDLLTDVSADGISVLEDLHEVHIPEGVIFNIVAEAESNIVGIQLRYRNVGQDSWSNADFDFIPSQKVTASLNLNISDPDYLPPGAEIEYYYVLSSAAGIVKKTPPAIIEYLDDRFRWDRTQIDSLLLLHHDVAETEVVRVVKEVREALNEMRSLLLVGDARPMKGVIYNTDSEAKDALPPLGQTAVAGELVFGGFSFPSNGVFLALGFQTTLIVHEATHLLLSQAVGNKSFPLPSWLDEGVANHKMPPEWKRFSGSEIHSQGSPLIEMMRVPETPSSIATFYQKAESIVAYLIKEYGTDSFQQLIAQLAEGRTTEDALLRSHGFGITDLEARWSEDNRWPPVPVSGTTTGGSAWREFLPVALGAVAVVVLVVVASAKRNPATSSNISVYDLKIDQRNSESVIPSEISALVFLTAVTRKLSNFQHPPPLLLSVGAAILVMTGSVSSWAEVRFEAYIGNQFRMDSVNGTGADGYVTFVASALALILLLIRLLRHDSNWLVLGGSLVLFFISGVLGITNLLDLSASIGAFSSYNLPSLGPEFVRTKVEVGWGLVVVTAASWAGLTSIAYQFWHDHRL